MKDYYYFRYVGSNEVKCNYVDLGSLPVIIYRQGEYQIWKVKGHTYRYGIDAYDYAPTEYFLVKVSRDDRAFLPDSPFCVGPWALRNKDLTGMCCYTKTWYAEVIKTITPGKFWKKELNNLKALTGHGKPAII